MINLRDYQEDSIKRTLSWLSMRKCNPLIVIPTGGGKSLIIADLCRRIIDKSDNARIVVATHVKELVEQNYEEIKRWWPEADIGICSAGLGHTDLTKAITVGTIQTLTNRWWAFGKVTHIIVDEAHMIPRKQSSRYQRLIKNIESRANRRIPLIGLTATPFRLDTGFLHIGDDAIFDIISANVPVIKLIQDGHLAPLSNRRMQTQIDTSQMVRVGEDFTVASMQKEIDRQNITSTALKELVASAGLRKSWLVFAVSIRHAHEICDQLNRLGIGSRAISSETPRTERDQIISEFREGKFRAIVSVNILTTGFNVPHIDLIAMLRPTLSTALYVQMLGRGMRTSEGKSDCAVLDFGGNIARHGPLNELAVQVEAPIESGSNGLIRTKVCPECSEEISVFYRTCPSCGHLFSEISETADLSNPIIDLNIEAPEPPKTPAEIVRSYIKVQKVGNDPFLEHLMDLRSSADEAA